MAQLGVDQVGKAWLMETFNTLNLRNRIFDPPTLQDLMDPPEEKEVRQGLTMELNRSDEAIMAEVQHEMAAAKGEVIEVKTDDDNDDTPEPSILHAETMSMCQLLECTAKEHGDIEEVLVLSRLPHRFRAKLRHQEFFEARQTMLDS